MHEIDMPTFAAAHASGATVIDVRQPSEYVTGHVPGARSIPLDRLPELLRLPEQLDDLREASPIYVVCASGVRSLTAANALAAAGVTA